MSYKFYINKPVKLSPINKEYSFVKDQYHLYDLLFNGIWTIDSCAPRLREDWNEDNKTLGQCSITSFLVQDIFGGEVYGVITPSGAIHCYNKVGDIIFDLTSEQFGDIKLEYKLEYLQSREEQFLNIEKYNRYLLIKKRLENLK